MARLYQTNRKKLERQSLGVAFPFLSLRVIDYVEMLCIQRS